jgi:hypothetical protein
LNKVQNFIYAFTHIPDGCHGKTTEKLNSIFQKLSDSDKSNHIIYTIIKDMVNSKERLFEITPTDT